MLNFPDCRVSFLVAGTQKGGTTALDAYLREHPAICMADEKEVHFFDDEPSFDGPPDYAKYHARFHPRKRHKVIGEATPIYMYWRPAPLRIWQYNPDMKIIVLLRNPITRAFSAWNMERARDCDNDSFIDAISSEEARCRPVHPYQHRIYSYIDRGRYSEQLQRLWSLFGREQVLALRTEDLRHTPQRTLDRIYEFLGLDSHPFRKPKIMHSGLYTEPMSDDAHAFLVDTFEGEIRNLERLLGWDCGDWLSIRNVGDAVAF